MKLFVGEIAALTTSLAWSLTSTFFTLAGRRVGAVVTNRVRLFFAAVFLSATHWIVQAEPIPLHAGLDRWFWLTVSGLIGLILGDAFLFQAFVWVGPRISMLMMSLAPVFAGLISWVALSERLSAIQAFGIFLTLAGVTYVVWQGDRNRTDRRNDKQYLKGVLFGVGAAAGQALGLITSKLGLGDGFPALSGTLMRVLSAMIVMWFFTVLRGQAKTTIQSLREDRIARWQLIAGSFVGPYLGIWLSLIAIQQTKVGIASALMSLPPIFLLPISRFVFGERFGWGAVVGTLMAVSGVVVLFLS